MSQQFLLSSTFHDSATREIEKHDQPKSDEKWKRVDTADTAVYYHTTAL